MTRWLGLMMCFAAAVILALALDHSRSQVPQPEWDAKGTFKGPKDKGPKKDAFPEEITAESWLRYFAWEFRKKDRNDDGYLAIDEMEGKLRDNLTYWDKNQDSLIDLREFEPFMRWKYEEKAVKEARKQLERERQAQTEPRPLIQQQDEDNLDRRPLVYRGGKLPKELPDWFESLDFDKDGQVALWEWRKGRKPLGAYALIDRNNDGLLTAEEVLRHESLARAKSNAGDTVQIMVNLGGGGKGKGWDKKGAGWVNKGK